MNKRRRSIPRRVRTMRSGYEQSVEEIKQHVAGLNELKKPGVSYYEEKPVPHERTLPEIIISSSEENEKKRLVSPSLYDKLRKIDFSGRIGYSSWRVGKVEGFVLVVVYWTTMLGLLIGCIYELIQMVFGK